jgi:hypothetical protein
MARFYGEIGYGETTETPPGSGVWVDTIMEYTYQGDVVRDSRRVDGHEKVNEDVVISNSISVVADKYLVENFLNIKYVRWNGGLWTVTTIQVQSPRLIMQIGSVYNGPTA